MSELNKALEVTVSKSINASASQIWKYLTDPALITLYLFGTETVTDWQEGGDIIFQGEYEGTTYKDGGKIIAVEPEQKLSYTYWSSFSPLPNTPENHSIVTYLITKENNNCILQVNQLGFMDDSTRTHTEANWEKTLQTIQDLINNEG